MSNTRSMVKLEASEKRRGQGLDDELWRHINMLGQTGRDLEKTKRKTQQEDKRRLTAMEHTQERQKRKHEWSSWRGGGADYGHNTEHARVSTTVSHMLTGTEVRWEGQRQHM